MTIPRFKHGFCFLAVALAAMALVFTVSPAAGQVPLSDTFNVYNPQGSVVYSVSVDEVSENPNQLYFIPTAGLADPNQVGNETYLLNPDASISDEFGVFDLGEGTFRLGFKSDGESGSLFGTSRITLQEGNGGPFDATMYLSFNLRDQGYTATFQSDFEASAPDGGTTLGLFAIALAALGLLHRKVRGQHSQLAVRLV